MARTAERDIGSSIEPGTIKYRIKREAQTLYAAIERGYAIDEPVDTSRSDWLLALTGVPCHVAARQVSDDRGVQGVIPRFGSFKAPRERMFCVEQLPVLMVETWSIGFRPREHLAQNLNAITESPSQHLVQRCIHHIAQQRFHLTQSIVNAVFQVRKIDRDEPVGSDQITIVRYGHSQPLAQMISTIVIAAGYHATMRIVRRQSQTRPRP